MLAALAAVGAGSAACDLSPPAASVDGSTVSRSQLDSELLSISQSAYAQCALEMQGLNLLSGSGGAGDFTVPADLASYELSTLVVERLADEKLEGLGHPVTSADLTDARTDLASELTPGSSGSSPCPGGIYGQQLVQRLPAGFRDNEVQFLAAQEQLAVTLGRVDVSTPALLAYYQAHQSQFQELCLSDIAVTSQAQAQSIRSAIESGSQRFAAEAQQSSIDTQTAADGGEIPCVESSEVVNSVILDAVTGLSQGQISQPVFENTSTSAGAAGVWFLLELDGRPAIPFADAESQIRQQLLAAQDSTVSAVFSRMVKAAKVSIDPRYGSWTPQSGIQPPEPPPADDLLSRTADQPGGSSSGGQSG